MAHKMPDHSHTPAAAQPGPAAMSARRGRFSSTGAIIALVVGITFAVALVLWMVMGPAVFLEVVAAGIAACF